MRDIPEPDYDDPKDLYAFYGLAMFNANLVETSLINLAVLLDIDKSPEFTKDVLEGIWVKMEAKTLGRLIEQVKKLKAVSDDLEKILAVVLDKRNYLAHHFFRNHSTTVYQEDGMRKMFDELLVMIEIFMQADDILTPFYMSLCEKMGITEEMVEQEFDKIRAGLM